MNFFNFIDRFPAWKPRTFVYAISGEPDVFREDIIKAIRARHSPGDLDYHRVEVSSEAHVLQLLDMQPAGSHRLVEIGDFENWGDRQYLSQWIETRTQANTIALFRSRR